MNQQVSYCTQNGAIVQNYSSFCQYGIRIQPGSGQTVSNITIEDIHFRYFYENAIKVRGISGTVSNITINRCTFSDIIGVRSASSYCSLNNLDDYGTSCAAIHSDNTTTFKIYDCTILGEYQAGTGRAAQTDGIYMQNNNGITIEQTTIKIKNDFITVVNNGQQPHIDAIQLYNCSDIKIFRNYVYNSSTIDASSNSGYRWSHRQGVYIQNILSGDAKIFNNIIRNSRGNGLINVALSNSNTNAYIFNNTLYGEQDMQHLAGFTVDGYTNNLKIKNNIFFKGQTNSTNITVKFEDISPSTGYLSNNLHFINNETVTPYINFNETFRTYDLYDENGINKDPDFTDLSADDFTLVYNSPAKNAGLGLKDNNLINDFDNKARPYWNKDYDIGAYEIQNDAQLKMGVYGSGTDLVFTISSVGTYWERNSLGTYTISSNQNYSTSACTVGVADADTNNWNGWDFGWLNQGSSDPNKPFAHGLYKVSYNSEKYFYLDYRDAIMDYSPNFYIQYNVFSTPARFEYLDVNKSFQPITNGSVLRVWNERNGIPQTVDLSTYWDHCLVLVPHGVNPQIIWGPYPVTPGQSTNRYQMYTGSSTNKIPPTSWQTYKDPGLFLDYIDIDHEIGYDYYYIFFKIKAEYQFDEQFYWSDFSNYVSFRRAIPEKVAGNETAFNYSLSQNYPNPFNPVTKITFYLNNPEYVILRIYDILGKEVKTLVNEKLEKGNYNYDFNAAELASGLYIYRISAGQFTETKKMQLLK